MIEHLRKSDYTRGFVWEPYHGQSLDRVGAILVGSLRDGQCQYVIEDGGLRFEDRAMQLEEDRFDSRRSLIELFDTLEGTSYGQNDISIFEVEIWMEHVVGNLLTINTIDGSHVPQMIIVDGS